MPILIPPVAPTGAFHDGVRRWRANDIWRFMTFNKGQSIVLRNGVWGLEETVAMDGAQEFYLGGHVSTISQAKADELTAAGFGAYIFPDHEGGPGFEGYGEGGFGAGPYGDPSEEAFGFGGYGSGPYGD